MVVLRGFAQRETLAASPQPTASLPRRVFVPNLFSMKLVLDLPKNSLSILRCTAEEFAGEMRLAAAVKWYELGRVSQGRAAELAGLSRAEFIDQLRHFGVAAIQVSADELASDTIL